MANIKKNTATENFRLNVRKQLQYNSAIFWEKLAGLPPKDFCDIYLKILPYGFAKMPDEKPLDEEGKQKLILEETTRKATIISGGLSENTEDTNYEEDT